MRTMPSARDTFRLSDLIEGRVRVRLFKRQPGATYVMGPPEEPHVIEDVALDWESPEGDLNAKAVNATLVLSGLFKDPSERAVRHLAVGTGPGSYNPADPPDIVTNEILTAELFRAPILFTNYVNGSGDPVLTKTNTVDLVFRFDFGEAVGTLEEMGLFGGSESVGRNTGLITNYKVFTPFVKASDRIMYVTWRIRFNI